MRNLVAILSLGLLLPATALAECSRAAVEDILWQNGYTYEYTGEVHDGKANAFTIIKDGSKRRLFAELDGDLSFRAYYYNHRGTTNDDAASVMQTLKYLQVYLDTDGDIVLSYDVGMFGGPRCNPDLNDQVRFFFGLVDAAEVKLME